MATYQEISNRWFFRLHPRGTTFEEYESEPAPRDREKTRALLLRMQQEIPRTVQRLFGIRALPISREGVAILDHLITPGFSQDLIDRSDPEDPNNELRLTLSEFAVHFGAIVIAQNGGTWRYARMPNYFESIVLVEGLEFLVFDILMKKASEDFAAECLADKYDRFAQIIKDRASHGLQ